MTARLLTLAMLLLATSSQAATVYQCTDAAGHPAFSDSPCSASAAALDVEPPPYIGSVSTYAADQRTIAHGLHDAARTARLKAIDQHQQAIINWRAAMSVDLARLTRAQLNTDNTVAGAIRSAQLATEKRAVIDQYNARIADSQTAIERLRTQLAE